MQASKSLITTILARFSTYARAHAGVGGSAEDLSIHDLDMSAALLEETLKAIEKKNFNHRLSPAELSQEIGKELDLSPMQVTLASKFFSDFQLSQANLLILGYTLALESEGCSLSTIKNYRSDISQFFISTSETTLDKIVTKPKLQIFLKEQKAKGLAPASIRRKLASINKFGIWLELERLVPPRSLSWLENVSDEFEKDVLSSTPPNLVSNTNNKRINKDISLNNSGNKGNRGFFVSNENPTTLPPQDSNSSETQKVMSSLKAQNWLNQMKHSLSSLLRPRMAIRSKTQAVPYLNKILSLVNGSKYLKKTLELIQLHSNLADKPQTQFLPYLNLMLSAILFLGMGYFGYLQVFGDVEQPLAFPTALTRPNRTLSFQGRLTDTNQNPIISASDMRFRLYDSGPSTSGGTLLWDSNTCSVTPDQDGIFAVGLGDDCGAEITSDVFSENANVWLQVEVEGEILDPRQSIKSVAYALNSETLQGFPPADTTTGATNNTVLVMNNSGEILIGQNNPKLDATSGTFTIEAQTLTLQTGAGSNGNINLDPDGTGKINLLANVDVTGYIKAPGATLSATYAGGTALTLNAGPSATADIMQWQNSAGSTLGVIDESGNIGIGSINPGMNLDVTGTGRFTGLLTTTGISNSTTAITNSAAYTQSGTSANTFTGTSTFSNGTYSALFTGGNVGIGSTSPSQKLDVVGAIRLGAAGGNNVLNTSAAGGAPSGNLFWGDRVVCDSNGSCGGSFANYWRFNLGTISPVNDTVDLLIGSNATASAKFAVLNVNSGTPNASVSSGVSGNSMFMTADGTLSTTRRQSLTIGNSTTYNTTGNVFINSNGTGNVGIGTTSSASRLEVFSTGTNTDVQRWIASDGSRLGRFTETSGGHGWFEVDNSSGTAVALFRADGGASYISSGNFGLGTTAPNSALDVAGYIKAPGATLSATYAGGTALTLNAGPSATADIMRWQNSAGSTLGVIDESGNIGIGTANPPTKLSIVDSTDPTIALTDSTNGVTLFALAQDSSTSFGNLTNHSLFIATNSLPRITILNDGNVGIGTTSPDFALQVNGTIAPETTDQDLGTASLRWDLFANTIDADSTVTLTGLGTGTDNTVLILNASNQVTTDEIDARVWGTTLVDGSGTANRVTYWTDADTVAADDDFFFDGTSVGIGDTTPTYRLDVNGTGRFTGAVDFDADIELNSTLTDVNGAVGTSGQILSSTGTGVDWVDLPAGAENYWRINLGAISPVNDTLDLLVGANATASAKFAVLNVNSGTPNASVSSGVSGTSMFMTADGTLSTTRRQSLTIGNSSTYNTTGNVYINPNGTGNVGIGTTTTGSRFDVVGASNTANIAQFMGDRPGANINMYFKHTSAADVANSARLTFQLNTDSQLRTAFEFISGFSDVADGNRTSVTHFAGSDAGSYGNRMTLLGGNFGIATETPTARLDVAGSASLSATLAFRGTTDPKIDILNGEHFGVRTSVGGNVGLTERLTLLNNGNVGIGDTTPTYLLDVNGTGRFVGAVDLDADLELNSTLTDINGSVGTNGQVLSSTASGVDWVDLPAATAQYWRLNLGTISPVNDTLDLLVGSNATASAKFAVLNVNSGTPNASVSSGVSGNSMFMTADGSLSTTRRQSLTIGNSTTYNTTGNVLINPNGTGNVGIGTTSPLAKLQVQTTSGTAAYLQTGAAATTAILISDATNYILTGGYHAAGVGYFGGSSATELSLYTDNTEAVRIDLSGNVGIGSTAPNDKLDVVGEIDTSTFYKLGNSKILDTENTQSLLVGIGAGNSMAAGANENTLVGANAGFSLSTGDNSVIVGSDAGYLNTTEGANVIVGRLAGYNKNSGANTYIGHGAGYGATNNTAAANVAVGNNALSVVNEGTNNIALGDSAGSSLTDGSYNILIGANTAVSAGTEDNSIALGLGALITASNQFVVGSGGTDDQITDYYFGSGVTDNTPFSVTFNASGGSGTNIAGANFTLAGGKGTGTGDGGDLIFQTSNVEASGTTLQSLTEKMRLTDEGNLGIGSTGPVYRLDVNGTGRFVGAVDLDADLELNSTLTDVNNSVGTAGQVLTSTSTGVDWVDASSLSVGDATTLDGLDSTQFLRSDTSDNYTSGTLTWNSGTTLALASGSTLNANSGSTVDINGDLTVADTNIAFDGASTTFTTTGAFTLTPGGAVALGDGGDTMSIDTSDWDISTAGAMTGISGITNDSTFTTSGGAVNINDSSNFATNINTGSSNGALSLGGGSGTVAVNSTSWDISTAGVASGFTGLTSSGTITFSGLTADRLVTTTTGGQLTTTISSANAASSFSDETGSGLIVFSTSPEINTSITTGSSNFDLLNITATTINFGGAASTLNIGPGGATATSVNLAGGSGATGCTVDGATGNFTCSGAISGSNSVWQYLNGAISPITPYTNNADLLVGSNATASAKFAVLNVLNGTPTASVSSGVSGNSMFMTSSGTLATTRLQSMNIGNSTTGGVFINPTGNIGIGTTASANEKLTLVGDMRIKPTGNNGRLWIEDNDSTQNRASLGLASGHGHLSLSTEGGGTNVEFYADSSQASYINAGNVGIGTWNPTSFKLQVAGHVGPNATNTYDLGVTGTRWRTGYFSTSVDSPLLTFAGTLDIAATGANPIELNTNGSLRWSVLSSGALQGNGASTIQTSTGNLTLTTPDSLNSHIILDPGSDANVGIGTTSIPTTLMIADADDPAIGFKDDGAPETFYMGLDSSSSRNFMIGTGTTVGSNVVIHIGETSENVGIGTTSTAYKLDVNGTGRFVGALDLDADLELNSTLTDINGSVGTSGQVLSSTASGVDWVDLPAATAQYWRLNLGTISPVNDTLDFLVGANATASAKFAVLNVNSGTPAASVSSGVSGTSMFMTADGTLATQNRQSLTLGNSSAYDTTGNVLINPNGTGNVGIGTTTPSYLAHLKQPTDDAAGALFIERQGGTDGLQLYNLNNGGGQSYIGTTTNHLQLESNGRMAFSLAGGGTGGNLYDFGLDSAITYSGSSPTSLLIGSATFAPTSDTGDFYGLYLAPTINQSGTATGNYTGIFLDVTETNVLGSTNQLMDLKVGGATQFIVKNNGNVGIGTGVPSSFKLQVAGHVGPNADDTYDLGSDGARWRDLFLGGDTLHIGTSTTDEGTISYNTTTNVLGISTDSTTNGDIAFFTDDIYLDKSGGSVGIGTTVPGEVLDVIGNIRSSISMYTGDILMGYDDSTATITTYNTDENLLIDPNGNGDILVNTDDLVVDTATGNIGIGSASPGQTLDVVGNVRISGLTASRAVFTNGSKDLVTSAASAALLDALTDETGTGVAVFGTSPAITTSLTTPSSSFDLLNTTATTINFGGAASTLNIGPGSTTATSINLAGGNGATGCTVDGATGNFSCTGIISGANTNIWAVTNGAISPVTPYTNNSDLLIGSNATASAKFAVLNIFPGSGTPTASVSSGLSGNSIFMTADGTLSTQRRQSLTIGNSSTYNTSGNVLINSNGTGNVGIGTTAPVATLDVRGKIRAEHASDASIYSIRTGGASLRMEGASLGGHVRTDSNHPLYLGANNIDHVTILANGNVGIGSTTPTVPLEIDTAAAGIFNIQRSGGSHDNTYQFRISQDGTGGAARSLYLQSTDQTGDILLRGANAGNMQLVLKGASGNVGIGTVSPSSQLEVQEDLNGDTVIAVDNQTAGTATRAILSAGTDTSTTQLYAYSSAYTTAGGQQAAGSLLYASGTAGLSIASGNTTSGEIRFYTDGLADANEQMVIQNDGNVGIGTTAPLGGLDVNGANGAASWTYIRGNAGSASNPSASAHGIMMAWNPSGGTGESQILYGTGAGGDPRLDFGAWDGATKSVAMTINDGNLGIGDTTPTFTLDVNGTGRFTGALTTTGWTNTGAFTTSGGIANINVSSNFAVNIGTGTTTSTVSIGGNANQVAIDSSTWNIDGAGVGSGFTQFTVDNLRLDGNTISSITSGGITMSPLAGQSLAVSLSTTGDFVVNTDDLVVDTSAGFVGIGTAAPSQHLDVTGTTAAIAVFDNSSLAAGKGGEVLLQHLDSVGARTSYASIKGYAFDGTNTTEKGYLLLNTMRSGTLTEAVRILDTGNVGINTTAPNAKLHVYGTSGEATPSLRIESDNGGATPQLIVENNDASTQVLVRAYGSGFGGSTYGFANTDLSSVISNNNIVFGSTGATDVAFISNNTRQMTLDSTGNFGIGIATPSEKLEVVGNIEIGGSGIADLLSSESTSSYLKLSDNTKGDINEVHLHARDHLLLGTTDEEIFLRPGDVDAMTLLTTGNVGIGTTAPTTHLYLDDSQDGTGTLNLLSIERTDPNTPATDMGVGLSFLLDRDDTAATATESGRITSYATSIPNRDYSMGFFTQDTGSITEKMTITANGNVGIGITAPSQLFEVEKDQNAYTRIMVNNATVGTGAAANFNANAAGVSTSLDAYSSGFTTNGAVRASGSGLYASGTGGLSIMAANTTSGEIRFYTDGFADANQRMVITNSGNIGIGSTTATRKLVVETSGASNYIRSTAYGTGFEGSLLLSTPRGTQASPTANAVDDVLGSVYFGGLDTNESWGARIIGLADEAWGSAADSTDAPGRLEFQTSANGAEAVTTRMTIKSNGNVGIGTTAPGFILDIDDRMRLRTGTSGTAGLWLADATPTNRAFIGLHTDTAASVVGIYNNADWRMVVDSNGNVGIADTTPTVKLDVAGQIRAIGSFGDVYAGYIVNNGGVDNYRGLYIQSGHNTGTGTSELIDFYDGDGSVQVGQITFTGTTVTYGNFTGNHNAELPANDNPTGYAYGTLVCLDRSYTAPDSTQPEYSVSKCTSANQNSIAGIYASKDNSYPNRHSFFAVGDGHALVTTENGQIKKGDSIVTSSYDGYGMKAAGPSKILGVSTGDWSEATDIRTVTLSDGRQVEAGLVPVYYYPGVFYPGEMASFTSEGQLSLNGSNGNYSVTATNGSTVTAVIASSKAVIGKITAGLINTKELVVQQSATIANLSVTTLQVSGKNINEYIRSIVQEELQTTSLPPGSVAQDFTTNNLTVRENASISGTLAAADIQAETLTATTSSLGSLLANTASISGNLTVAQDASVAGTLIAGDISAGSSRFNTLEARMAELENIKAQTAELVDATVSGTLYADSIYNFDEKVASAFKKPSLLELLTQQEAEAPEAASPASIYEPVEMAGYASTNPDLIATDSAILQLDETDVVLGSSAIFVEKYLEVNGHAYVAQSLGIGDTLKVGNSLVITNGTIDYQPAGVESPTLAIQSSGQGKLDLLAGVMTIENGLVSITGDLTIAGKVKADTLLTNLVQPADFGNPFQVQVAGASTESGEIKKTRFEIINETGEAVATFDAEGNASFAGGVSVGNQNLTEEEPEDDTVVTDKSSGQAKLSSGKDELKIETPKATPDSLIYVTPKGSTENKVLYIKGQGEGEFTVGFDEAIGSDVEFNWWIVN